MPDPTCPGCHSPATDYGGPARGPKWTQFECGSVLHMGDGYVRRTKECYRRENQTLRADLDTLRGAT